MSGDGMYMAEVDTAASLEDAYLRIDVYPPSGADFPDLSPQSLRKLITTEMTLNMSPTVDVSGSVAAFYTSPWADSDLPGVQAPVPDARVAFVRQESIQNPYAITDENGSFQLPVVWDNEPYEVSVRSDEPAVPITTLTAFQDDYSLGQFDLDLGSGVAVYGRVMDTEGAGLPESTVFVLTEGGTESTRVLTDEAGWYTIRVQPERSYKVMTEGRNGRDPVISSDWISVESDTHQDLVYQTLVLTTVRGAVVNDSDLALDDVTVRFIATSLTGYDNDNASHQYDVRPTNGLFDTSLPPGIYDVEVIPNTNLLSTPHAIRNLSVASNDVDLGEILLDAFVSALGSVEDEAGDPVDSTVVSCRENGFGERTWSTSTDPSGSFFLTLPNIEVECTLIPPTQRSDLARTRHIFTPVNDETVHLLNLSGELITGTLLFDDSELGAGIPVESAIIEVRDNDNQLLGSTVSDSSGSFGIRFAASAD